MLATVLPWVVGALTLALALAAWRLLRGPDLPDRILALDTLYINALALLVALGLSFGHKHYFEVALLIGLLGFIGTVVLAKYLLRGDITE
ncbi:K+/H+ antiporter subunit F [Ideonella sp. A 288]|uniref:K+/H+ antiporter subunit F n=1 Tax=Ideonella sp. A 288 TaxID=1962181 RepID=UPI000B4C1D35|nr:K+/H+ antiporter subunit F [Ideonella sp. A 288]